MHADPGGAKKLLDMTFVFALLGPMSIKAACRMLMKLIPEANIFFGKRCDDVFKSNQINHERLFSMF